MSEKRFKLDIGDDYSFIDDIIQDETYTIYNDRFKEVWGQKIVDLLNQLNDENEQLKEENKELNEFNNLLIKQKEESLDRCQEIYRIVAPFRRY